MDIILLKDYDTLGFKHDVVTVKDGFGRNYLIPQGIGLIANKSNLAKLDDLKRREKAQEAKRVGEYQQIASRLESEILKIGAKAGASGKIFGSVTEIQVIQALKDQLGVELDRRKVELPNTVKELGNYEGVLRLYEGIDAPFKFEVIEDK